MKLKLAKLKQEFDKNKGKRKKIVSLKKFDLANTICNILVQGLSECFP